MIQGSEQRQSEHPIDRLFLDRWSPRAMSGEDVPESELSVLFEAARWAPSSYNNQPWRILYARRGGPHWPLFFNLLVDANKTWARDAAALLLFVSKTTFDHNGKPSITHAFDTGAAWENLALQATLRGLVAHAMQGFDAERARRDLHVPDGYALQVMVAIGKPGNPASLPEEVRKRELPSGRRDLAKTVCEGPFAL